MKKIILVSLLLLTGMPGFGEYQPDQKQWEKNQDWEKKQRQLHEKKQWEQDQQSQQQHWQKQQKQQGEKQWSQASMKPPVLVAEIGFAAKAEGGKVAMSWKKYARPDFKYYKVVRSNFKKDPVYPEDGAIKFFDDASQTSYADANVQPGTWYYRLCVITQNGDRWVSSVATVQIGGGSATPSTPPGAGDFE